MAISDLEYLDFDRFVLSFDSQLENIEENICLSRFATQLPRCVACGSLCPSAASRVSLEVSASAAPRHPFIQSLHFQKRTCLRGLIQSIWQYLRD